MATGNSFNTFSLQQTTKQVQDALNILTSNGDLNGQTTVVPDGYPLVANGAGKVKFIKPWLLSDTYPVLYLDQDNNLKIDVEKLIEKINEEGAHGHYEQMINKITEIDLDTLQLEHDELEKPETERDLGKLKYPSAGAVRKFVASELQDVNDTIAGLDTTVTGLPIRRSELTSDKAIIDAFKASNLELGILYTASLNALYNPNTSKTELIGDEQLIPCLYICSGMDEAPNKCLNMFYMNTWRYLVSSQDPATGSISIAEDNIFNLSNLATKSECAQLKTDFQADMTDLDTALKQYIDNKINEALTKEY